MILWHSSGQSCIRPSMASPPCGAGGFADLSALLSSNSAAMVPARQGGPHRTPVAPYRRPGESRGDGRDSAVRARGSLSALERAAGDQVAGGEKGAPPRPPGASGNGGAGG